MLSLPFARFIEITRVISEARQEEARFELQRNAHLGYQIVTAVAGFKGSFKDYLSALNLTDEPIDPTRELPENERARLRAEAIAKAEAIVQRDKQRRIKA